MHKIILNKYMRERLQSLQIHYVNGCCGFEGVNTKLCMGNFIAVLANEFWADKKPRLSRAVDKISNRWHEQHNGCSWDMPTEFIVK